VTIYVSYKCTINSTEERGSTRSVKNINAGFINKPTWPVNELKTSGGPYLGL
jgi:hypothetical protein